MAKVMGIGGVFFKAKDPDALRAWYQTHLGIDVQPWGGAAFKWRESEIPNREGAGKFGWVTDPEGNKIELWEPPRTS